ncbi:biotin--[acetyl-CoA-carboxylase] ligase [Deinococcus sp.]|uniref:biotin--[acetyl-CoA-carboxylase] ligase n=1 Tax=Deinococcus sp. TaxID=47478 RepID=UPI003B5C14FD
MPNDLLGVLSAAPQLTERLATRLRCDPATIRGWARALQRQGVPLEMSELGYALSPGTPTPQAVQAAGFARPYRYCAQIGSTQDELRRWADDAVSPAPAGAVLLAESQTGGRGRRGRTWHAPPLPGAALLFSVLLPVPAQARLNLLPLAAGLAVRDACRAALPPGASPPGLKWPNDLLSSSGGKLAGMLLEAEWRGPEVRRAVLGIGLNVRAAPEGAACLQDLAAGHGFNRAEVLAGILAALDLWLRAENAEVLDAWRQANVTLGQFIQVQTQSGPVSGMAQDINDDGELRLSLPSGQTLTIGAGDVALIGTLKASPENGPPGPA